MKKLKDCLLPLLLVLSFSAQAKMTVVDPDSVEFLKTNHISTALLLSAIRSLALYRHTEAYYHNDLLLGPSHTVRNRIITLADILAELRTRSDYEIKMVAKLLASESSRFVAGRSTLAPLLEIAAATNEKAALCEFRLDQ